MFYQTGRLSLIMGVASLMLVACGDGDKASSEKKRERPAHLVEAVTVENTPLSFTASRTGSLAARKSVRVFNQEEGRIDKVPVREGDAVKAGDIIVELDSRLLSASLAKAVATRQEAEANLQRALELIKRKVTTQERLEKAETALSITKAEESLIRTRLDYARIRAPFDGIVTERRAEPGDIAPRYSHLLTVIDLNSLYTNVSVSELMIPHLQVGGSAEVRIDALGDKTWPARIVRIHPSIDPRTRQGTVEVGLDPVPVGAAAGQLCRVLLRTPVVTRLVIPFAALRNDRDGEFVYLVEKGKAAIRRVRTGLRLEDRIEILEGLAPGDKVVVRGFLDLAAGKRVSVIGEKPAGEGKKGGGKKKGAGKRDAGEKAKPSERGSGS